MMWDAIPRIRPQVVILAASWSHAADSYRGDPRILRRLVTATLQRLHALGVRQVILVGDSPRYMTDVEQIALRSTLRRDGAPPLPTFDLDAPLAAAAAAGHAQIALPRRVLCHDGSCRIVDDGGALLHWDEGHLTFAGSRWMAERMLRAPLTRALAGAPAESRRPILPAR